MKENRVLICGLLGGVILISILWYVSWKWASSVSVRIGVARFQVELWEGNACFKVFEYVSSPRASIFNFNAEENDDFNKNNFRYSGLWFFSSSNPKDILLIVPAWLVGVLVSIFGVGIAYEMLHRSRSRNASSSCDLEPLGHDELNTAEQEDGGSRDDR